MAESATRHESMRGLDEVFLADLQREDGILHPILESVHRDRDLVLEIRWNYINLYFKGHSLLKLSRPKRWIEGYKVEIDEAFRVDTTVTLMRIPLNQSTESV